jgi:glyoxylase-like metal-dependent hydrolase (beta-lactamase superfamily II)
MHQIDHHGPVTRLRFSPAFLGRPRLWANLFWVDGLLIDTGCRRTLPELMALLRTEGLTVEQLVNTHTHEDHVAGNKAINTQYGVTPKVHTLGLPRLAHPEPRADMDFYRRFFWGPVDPCPGEALGETVETDHYRFRVLHTPGHAPDHVALWEESQGWLFSGDLLISQRLVRTRRHENPPQTLQSMRQLAALPATQLFCSHAYKVYNSTAPLQAKIGLWERLQREAAAMTQAGLSTGQAARRLLGRNEVEEWISLGDLSKRNLIAGLLRDGDPDRQAAQGGTNQNVTARSS